LQKDFNNCVAGNQVIFRWLEIGARADRDSNQKQIGSR